MANTKKKTTEKTESKETKTELVDTEKEMLKKQLEEMQKQMIEMKKAMADFNSKSVSASDATSKNRMVTIVALSDGLTILKGTRIHQLEPQFTSRTFSENEARVIVSNMPNAVAKGLIYIVDRWFIEEMGLEDIYHSLLDGDTLKNLLDKNAKEIVKIYKEANDAQKGIILDMIINKRMNNEMVDANVLQELGKISGKDLINIDTFDDEQE